MFIPNCIKFDTMKPDVIQYMILKNCDVKEPIRKELLWIKCLKPNRNKFTDILRDMIKENWIRKTSEGIIRIDFSKEDSIILEFEWLKKWCIESRKIIAKENKPLFKKTKKGHYYLTLSAQQSLTNYFLECDYTTLNILNRNFLAFRLKLITPNKYKKNLKAIEDRFDYLFFSLINDHRSFKEQLVNYYMNTIHKTEFKV